MTAKFKVLDLPPQATCGAALITLCAADVTPQPVEWLWPGRIALGKLTLIAGEAGLGKSQLSIAMAAAVTTGGEWPCLEGRAPQGSVVILSAEDGAADTVVPRLMAAGADRERVELVSTVRDAQSRRSFDLSADLALLEQKISEIGDVKLIIIDPISSYLGPKVDSHVNAAVRGVLEPVSEMAVRLRIAIVAITHPPKGTGTTAINRFIGSIAFVAAARAAFLVTRDGDNQDRRLLLPVKNNLAPLGKGLAFWLEQRIVGEPSNGILASSITWESEPVTITADQALAAADGNSEQHSAQREAEDFLRENLSAPATAKEMEEHARAVGISSRTLARARKRLGVIAEKGGMDKGWTWRLPGPSDSSDNNQRYAPIAPKNAKPPEECHPNDWQPSAKLAAFGAASATQWRAPDVTDPADPGPMPDFLVRATKPVRAPALGPVGDSLDDLAPPFGGKTYDGR
jgi:putative DNA primase/helicase